MTNKKPEILAPCGSMSALKAAVAAGADACYLAGNSFGARAYAENFDGERLIEAIELAHLNDVKVYLTANTLVKNGEIEYLYEFMRPLYENGLDAVLVQDFGVLRMLREAFPGLPIHTSTQMNLTTVEGARLAKSLGAERVVAAREMTLSEFKNIKDNVDIELEAFVHGAMCFCYSGRCLMSSMAGGRSGNRGRCAQPCRKKYNGSYKLSMRDMCTLQYVPQLIEAGVDSLKIEGRMKNEYYVAAVVDAYKQMTEDYLQGVFSERKARYYEKRLLDTFNRGGFTTGYVDMDMHSPDREEHLIDDSMPGRRGVLVGNVGRIQDGKIGFKAFEDIFVGDELLIDVNEPISITSNKEIRKGQNAEFSAPGTKRISKGTLVYRTRCLKLQNELAELINRDNRISVSGSVVINAGKELELTLYTDELTSDDGACFAVTVNGAVVSVASSRPVSDDVITDKLSKMGDSCFILTSLAIDNDNNSFIPMSELNGLRRSAVEALRKCIVSSVYRDVNRINNLEDIVESGLHNATTREVHISVSNPDQLTAVNDSTEYDYIYFDMGHGKWNIDSKQFNGLHKTIIALPYVNRGEYSIFNDYIDMLSSADGVYIRCNDDLAEFIALEKNPDSILRSKTLILASSIYAYNNMAVAEIMDMLENHTGEIIFEASVELSKREADGICYPKNVKVIRDVYGRIPLMVTAAFDGTKGVLKDDKQYGFVSRKSGDYHYSLIYNNIPLGLNDYLDEIQARKYSFTTESPAEVRDVFSSEPRFIKDKHFTRGHFEKGI